MLFSKELMASPMLSSLSMASLSLKSSAKSRTALDTLTEAGLIGRINSRPSKLRARLSATYAWPLEKAPRPKSIATRSKVRDWLLWMVIAQASLRGSCSTFPVTVLIQRFSFASYS